MQGLRVAENPILYKHGYITRFPQKIVICRASKQNFPKFRYVPERSIPATSDLRTGSRNGVRDAHGQWVCSLELRRGECSGGSVPTPSIRGVIEFGSAVRVRCELDPCLTFFPIRPVSRGVNIVDRRRPFI